MRPDEPTDPPQGPADAARPEVLDIVTSLCAEEAEFLVVGAFGVTAAAAPHAAESLTILVRPAADNAARVWRALHRFGVPVAARGLSVNDLAHPGMPWQIGAPPRRIDVITDVGGLTFDQAWQSRVVVDWHGCRVGVLGHGALLVKQAGSGRQSLANGSPTDASPEPDG